MNLVVLRLLLAGESPGRFLESKLIETSKQKERRFYSVCKREYYSWLNDAETPTGASPSPSARLFRQSRNLSRWSTNISSPPTSICVPHGCGNGRDGIKTPSTSPSPCSKLGVLKSNPRCNRREQVYWKSLLRGSPLAALSYFAGYWRGGPVRICWQA